MNKYCFIILMICVSCILLVIITPNNLGTGPDSVSYIKAAQNIANGKGYVVNNRYVTHWPPGYSILLSVVSRVTGATVIDSGKFLNIFLFILLGISFMLILDELIFNNYVKYFLPLLFLSSRPLTVSLMFWSELPFILFIVLTFLFFLKWNKTNKKSMLILAGIMSMLALITRYAAIGFLGGFLINVIMTRNRTYRSKFSDILYYLMPIIIGMGVWFFYTHLHSIPTTNRSLVVHIISFEKILSLKNTFISWLANDINSKMVLTLFTFLVMYVFISNKNRLQLYVGSISVHIYKILILISSYIIFLMFSISFLDAYTPLDNRILSPLSPFLCLLLGYILNFIFENSSRWKKIIAMIMIFYCSISSGKYIWLSHYKEGAGYTSKKFSQYLDSINEYVINFKGVTYTNGTDLIQFYNVNNQLKLRQLPHKFNPNTERINYKYADGMSEMKKNILQNQNQIVYFDNITWRRYFPAKEELLNHMNPIEILEFKNGIIIRSKED